MTDNNFKKEDKQQVIDFLNFIAENAKFDDWTTEKSIKHFRMLNFMQSRLLPLIEANTLEVNKIVPPKEEAKGEE